MKESNIPESDNRKTDWLSILIVSGAFLILFFSAYKSEGLKSAVLTVAILYAFPISFGVHHYIMKLINRYVELETIIVLGAYSICLLCISFLANDWEFVLIFPAMSFLWWFTDWAGRMLKLFIKNLFNNRNA